MTFNSIDIDKLCLSQCQRIRGWWWSVSSEHADIFYSCSRSRDNEPAAI